MGTSELKTIALGKLTGPQVRKIRHDLGLSQQKLATILGLGVDGRRTVGRWEMETYPVPGPAAYALRAMAAGFLPDNEGV